MSHSRDSVGTTRGRRHRAVLGGLERRHKALEKYTNEDSPDGTEEQEAGAVSDRRAGIVMPGVVPAH